MLTMTSSYKGLQGVTERIWRKNNEIVTQTKELVLEIDEGLVQYGRKIKEGWSIREDIAKTIAENIANDFFSVLKGKRVLFLFNEIKDIQEVIEKIQEIAKEKKINSLVVISETIEDEEDLKAFKEKDKLYKKMNFKKMKFEKEYYLKKDIQ